MKNAVFMAVAYREGWKRSWGTKTYSYLYPGNLACAEPLEVLGESSILEQEKTF